MPYEIEMLSVKAADAIIIRYFGSDNEEVVILIDAGHKSDGKKIKECIDKWTINKKIDLAICTHPDADHIGGFFYVVEKIPINRFWIHDPNNHVEELEHLLETVEEDITLEKSLTYVVENLQHSKSLLEMIDEKGIPREEPFAGLTYPSAQLTVVGPTIPYYQELLSEFRDADVLLEEENMIQKSMEGDGLLMESLSSEVLLNADNDKSRENNSSAILLFEPEGKKYLFTADAGPEALLKAHQIYDLSGLDWLDVPHHGSRYNLTTELLDIFKPKTAYISCDGSKHYPSKVVVEELKKRKSKVFSTANGAKLHFSKIDVRPGYYTATPL